MKRLEMGVFVENLIRVAADYGTTKANFDHERSARTSLSDENSRLKTENAHQKMLLVQANQDISTKVRDHLISCFGMKTPEPPDWKDAPEWANFCIEGIFFWIWVDRIPEPGDPIGSLKTCIADSRFLSQTSAGPGQFNWVERPKE